jgi:hypothetical protein
LAVNSIRTADGILIIADANDAYNIVIKAFPKVFEGQGIKGFVFHLANTALAKGLK